MKDRQGGALVATDGAAFPLIAVDDAPIENTQLVVERAKGKISGVVRDQDGEPFGEAWVGVIATDETTPNELRTPTLSGRSGTFSFEGLLPGQYNIYAASTRGDATASLEGVPLGVHDITLDPLGTIAGQVTKDGKPIELFTVTTEHLFNRSFSDSSGRFELERVLTGPQRLVITAPGGAASKSINVVGGEETFLTIELAEWGSIEGRAVDEHGDPLVGVGITLVATGGRRNSHAVYAASTSGSGPVTDADGRFFIEGIGPGVVQVDLVTPQGNNPQLRATLAGRATPGEATDLGEATLRPPQSPE
ncbi:MAG: carboxypeptidase regulatory-like domain-containing protein [Nannocystaceae bacterium]|nr:carboxypeptidase regulatory-like domain-containing protein [Nannocystaceae bacterium]